MKSNGRPRRITFLMRSPGFVRNFEWVLRALAARGCTVTVLFEERKVPGDAAGLALVHRLRSELPTVSFEFLPPFPVTLRSRTRMGLQVCQDYLRYFEVPYGGETGLRARVLAFVPPRVERFLSAALGRMPKVRRAIAGSARWLHALLGDHPWVRTELARRRPDVLVVSPMVHVGSRQALWVRAARRLGVPSALCVHSWDSLVSKGLLHEIPDRIVVWNDIQAEQAADLHGAPRDAVFAAGAWPFEHWRDAEPSRSREDLLAELGLPADRALILYAGSSSFIAGNESPAFLRWLRAVRSSDDPAVANANVIVRPHPLNAAPWQDERLSELEGVVIFPRRGQDPADEFSRADYFDSVAHADAVVAINTSALIESSVIGRPTLAFPGPDFASRQEALPHLQRLAKQRVELRNAAIVGPITSESMDEHLDELGRIVAGRSTRAEARRRFVDEFVCFNGDGVRPSHRVATLVEELIDDRRRADPRLNGDAAPAGLATAS